ncbi:proheparin-binding EGF-like growth factor [Bombina bombina]|uniref:proheparin-binding EGF-like growth factor n=1 Tax=Bombina bombina TaxID=8345 RepID=UPI00235B08D9|nr:proheparin-binding EGF-like growth factor [Bombina bombina]
MKLLKLLLVILIEVSYVTVFGAVIEPQQNEVFHKTTSEFAAVGESHHYEDKKVLAIENHILALPGAVSSSKPEDVTRQTKGQKKKRKGKGKKRDPCRRKFKDFCIHGECRYMKLEKTPFCVCQEGYHGQRCHALSLPLEKPLYTYDHTTVLAVVAVTLSCFCLIVISTLLILRYHKRGAYNVENEEKFKFGSAA